jgi:hypothetical protein
MIFGMVDPTIAGYQPEKQTIEMNYSHGEMQHDHSMHHH